MDTLNMLLLATDRMAELRRQADLERLAAAARRLPVVAPRRILRVARRPAAAEPCR
jgi:hypothetical protein